MNKFKQLLFDIKYLFKYKLMFLGIYFSPFKRPKIRFYFGKISKGVPYFLPRKTVKSKTQRGYYEFKPVKWLWFQLIGLGYKTKWHETDYRHEWDPMISIVILKMQFCIKFELPYYTWEQFLIYRNYVYKIGFNRRSRINYLTSKFSQAYVSYSNGTKTFGDHYYDALKPKYHKYIREYERKNTKHIIN